MVKLTSWTLRLFMAAALVSFAGTAHAQYDENEYYEEDVNGQYYEEGYDEYYEDYWQQGAIGEGYEEEELSELEYEADEGLHEEEWYDPSDWFDTGAGVSYESDYDDYGYDDYGWGYDYDDDNYYTNDWYDDAGVFNEWY